FVYPVCLAVKWSATHAFYTLSLHDALPIFAGDAVAVEVAVERAQRRVVAHQPVGELAHAQPQDLAVEADPVGEQRALARQRAARSEEHTSELQSRENLVCRLLLEKKKKARQ